MLTKSFCEMAFRHFKVNCEGDAMMCCDQPYGLLGNVLQTPPEEMWNSDLAKSIRKEITEARLPRDCQKMFCPYKTVIPSDCMREIYHEDYPISMEIDLPNTHCNVGFDRPSKRTPACVMCPRSSKYFKPEIDRLELVCRAIAPLLKGLSTLHIQGIAEPFYKDKMFDVLDWLEYDTYQLANPQIVVSTITNGILFNPKCQSRFNERCPRTRVCFSMDAASRETYKKIRILDVYDVVRNNLIGYGQSRNKQTQELWINNNINVLNVQECVQMVEDAAEAQVDKVQFTATDPLGENIMVDGVMYPTIAVTRKTCRQFGQAGRDAVKRGKELSVPVTFRKPLDLGMDVIPLI